jgi:hypothetical protein
MVDKTLMEEMDDALEDVVQEPETEIPDADSVVDDAADEGAEGDTAGDREAADEGEAEETDEEAQARGAERNPDGTFKKKGEEVAPEGDKSKPAKAEPKKADPVNDPIPKDLKKDTQERIRTLIDTTKTVTAERDEIKQNFDYMVNGIQATGATPAQYGETLSWLALFNSRDPEQQVKALELVESVADRLATLLGRERAVGDPLAAHADLKAAVTAGQLTPQYAKEIARVRNGQQFRTELTTNATREQQQQQQSQQEEAQGRAALTELENTLRASDPEYDRKKAVLVPALKPLMASIPWGQRKDKFLEAYRNMKLPAAAKPKGVPPNQPMRAGKQPAGGQVKAPGSMLEAISGALGSMGK